MKIRWSSAGYAGFFLGALLGSAPAYALDVKPGLWEITTETIAEAIKACLTQENLDTDISDMKMPEGIECTNDFKEKSGKLIIMHFVCTGHFNIEGDSRLEVLSPESMTIQSTSVMKFGENERNVNTQANYKWLSNDCGDVKPIELRKDSS